LKDPLKDFWNCKMFFLRDRAAFLVGVSKHGWRMDDRESPLQPTIKKKQNPMDATANFSLRFTPAPESKVERTDWLLRRQTLQRISTGVCLVSLALGFWVFAMLIFTNRHQAEVNSVSGGSSFAMVGVVVASLLGAAFLFAACLHWRFCARHSASLQVRRQSAPAVTFAVLS
jgi:hypothetical protein